MKKLLLCTALATTLAACCHCAPPPPPPAPAPHVACAPLKDGTIPAPDAPDCKPLPPHKMHHHIAPPPPPADDADAPADKNW